ncbi:MAG: acyl-CoA dehydrogenase family protein [Desulfobacterales bacterium]
MAVRELDMTITKEALAMQKEAKRFAMDVLRPAGIALDRLQTPEDVIASGSILWDTIKTYRDMDLHLGGFPEELGGVGDMDPMASILINEELAYGDVGLAISLGVSAMPFSIAAKSEDPELRDLAAAYCSDKTGELIGCWCMMEPDHGSDWILTAHPGFDDPAKVGVATVRAVKKGDEYIINGQKAAWVSNGSIATHGVVHLNLDPARGMRGDGLAIIPLDLPGITRGKPLNKIGQRPLNQGEIFFDEVRLPAKYMVVPDAALGTMMKDLTLIGANTGMGILFTGVAQAAFDEALNYAKNRKQGGTPIFDHQSVRLRLFEMFKRVETSRALSRRVALFNMANNDPLNGLFPSGAHGMALKVYATETAFKVASEALQIFGGNGLSKEYPIEKIFRDARASMIEDGENNVLSLVGAAHL